MKKHSIISLFPHYEVNRSNWVEMLLVLSLCCGTFLSFDILDKVRYFLLLVMECILIFKYCHSFHMQNLVVLLYVFFIFIVFVCIGVNIELIINRILPMMSVFGIIIVEQSKECIDIDNVIKKYLNFYVYLALLISADYIHFLVSNNGIWKPITYLGYRACGPFGDPNFLALYSGVALLLLWNIKSNRKFRIFGLFIVAFTMIIARSLSAMIFLLVACFINKIWANENRKKCIFILVTYFLFIYLYGRYSDIFREVGTDIISKLYSGDMYKASVKYISLEERFMAQYQALKIFIIQWWGQGPRQMVSQLGRDTHNSYIGFLFEQGILGIVLIIITLRKRTNNCFNGHISWFIILMGLVLNVHMNSIYVLFLISQYSEQNEKADNGVKTLYEG